MAAAISLPENVKVGDSFVVTGTGFANTTAYTVKVTQKGQAGPSVTFQNTTSGGGVVDTTSKLTIIANAPGKIQVEVSDGSSTVDGEVTVWSS